MKTELIFKYFTTLNEEQKEKFSKLEALYHDWNQKINVVSRKDIDELYLRHVLHSLGIAKIQIFNEGADILDVGTGGDFRYPIGHFISKRKIYPCRCHWQKIKVVNEVVEGLGLENVETHHARVEDIPGQFDFIVSRAVAAMPTFVHWTKGKIKKILPTSEKMAYFILRAETFLKN